MAQLFHPSANTIARASIFGALLLVVVVSWVGWALVRSPYVTEANVAREQPVPFSHQHHVSGLGIDCRFCHTSVTDSSYAGLPPTKTCMTCHSKIWTNAAMLEPVRSSWATGRPIEWTRVHNLPDFAYFNHSIHVQKGIGCSTCHGRVDQMPLTWQVASLRMEWCLGCHREPERYIRPREQVFDMEWTPPKDQEALGRRLVQEYHVPVERLQDCYTCHR